MISNYSTGKECLDQASINDSHHEKTHLMWRLISKLQGWGGRVEEKHRERDTQRLKLKFINACKNPVKILQFMAVKQVYMLESLEISHLRQIIWCFMNYQKFKRQILIAQYHILSETWFSYSSEILFYLLLLTRVISGK